MPEATLKSALTVYAINDGRNDEVLELVQEQSKIYNNGYTVEKLTDGTVVMWTLVDGEKFIRIEVKPGQVVYRKKSWGLTVTTQSNFSKLYHTVVSNAESN